MSELPIFQAPDNADDLIAMWAPVPAPDEKPKKPKAVKLAPCSATSSGLPHRFQDFKGGCVYCGWPKADLIQRQQENDQ